MVGWKSTLLACAAAAVTSLSALAASAQEITWWAPDWGKARAEKLINDFQAANPDIKVKLEVTISNGLQNRIQIVLRGGSPPDLIDTSIQWVPAFANTGKLLALDEWAAKNIDLPDLLPATVASATLNGKLYGLPYRAQTLALIYNKGLYREAGLDPEKPPQTWDEFLEASKKLTRKNAKGEQQYGVGVAGGGEVQNIINRMMPFMWMNGGSVISEDEKKAVVNEPAAVAGLEFYTKPFTELGIAPPSTLQNDALAIRRLFDAGTVAQYFSGQYDLAPIKQEAPDIEVGASVYPYPAGKQTAGVLSGWAFIVPAEAKNKEAALKFAAFLMKPDNMGYYTDTFPASKVAMNLPRFQDPVLKPFKDMLPFAKPAPSHPAWLQTVQIMFDKTQEVLLKRSTPQKAMDDAAKRIQALLDKS